MYQQAASTPPDLLSMYQQAASTRQNSRRCTSTLTQVALLTACDASHTQKRSRRCALLVVRSALKQKSASVVLQQ